MDKDKGVFMTAREVNMEIEMLKTVFDIVRLVDVSRTAPVILAQTIALMKQNINALQCGIKAEDVRTVFLPKFLPVKTK